MASPSPVKVLGLCGSLRRGSLNAAALRAARELAPPGLELTIFEGLREIPPYDDDLRHDGYPPPVQALRDGIRAADAVLIATPEYNYSVPGVLKNAIDWASRPPEQPFEGKPVGIMGASPGAIGTARAQYHLRQSFVFLNALVLNRPEVMIGQATSRFDAEGRLTDEKTREFVQSLLVALRDWTLRLRR
ncbi:NADPH-dependent FMN reductase [Roseicella frigidaeris]|uniref:NADPH-dependent FMN reductase n=1 Tax=Roseicella frigidaeris TaxID=2230885 RepID=A0A327MF28_9PROT|nr:NADPH-dependent FMN reductase [Roseicella frigidaeris]RAI61075.1 NADPH-dependent FMN reductase [Roseicella frigidaeris]